MHEDLRGETARDIESSSRTNRGLARRDVLRGQRGAARAPGRPFIEELMVESTLVLVLASTLLEFKRLRDCLPDWECECVLSKDGTFPALPPTYRTPSLLLVYARKIPEETQSVCRLLRQTDELREIPILLVVEPTDARQVDAVEGLKRASAILTPLIESELRDTIAELLAVCGPREAGGSDPK